MTIPQPGQVPRYYTGVTLNTENDVVFGATLSGYRFIYNGSQFGVLEYNYNTNLTELNLWNNDGTPASNIIFENKYLLDVNYDKADDIYYGIRWNEDAGYSPGDIFAGQYDTESGTESAKVLMLADFSSAKNWQYETIDTLSVETTLIYNPPTINISRTSRRWTSYSGSYYAYSAPTWAGTTWGSAFTQSAETAATDLFQQDYPNSRLIYYSNGGPGYYEFDTAITGNFVAYMDVEVTSFNGPDSVLALRLLRESSTSRPNDPYNQLASVCYNGPHTSPTIQAWLLDYVSDTAGSYWTMGNFRISERYLTSGAVGNVVGILSGAYCAITTTIQDYAQKTGEKAALFNVVANGTALGYGAFASATSITTRYSPYYGETYRSFSWTGGTASSPYSPKKVACFDVRSGYSWDEQTFVFTDSMGSGMIGTSKEIRAYMTHASACTTNTQLRLAIKRVGTTVYVMQRNNMIDIDDPGGAYSTISSRDLGYSGPARFELYVDGTDGTNNNIAVKKVMVRNLFASETSVGQDATGASDWGFPVLTVETYDVDGFAKVIPGLSSDDGSAIRSLDLVQRSKTRGGNYSDFLGRVQLATDHNESGRELYINIGSDLYKYAKGSLPIMTAENGVNAAIVSYGVISGTSYYNTLNYNGYTNAGLFYMAENEADPGAGVYLNCVRNETMTKNIPPRFSWLESADTRYYLYGVDVNQPYLLYGLSVTDMKLYLYNMNEDKAAFCNVVSTQQIMGANTAATSQVAGQVLNIYGDPLEGKTVQFAITAGDGSVSPSSDTTDADGEAHTTYTVGSTVGLATITATVTN